MSTEVLILMAVHFAIILEVVIMIMLCTYMRRLLRICKALLEWMKETERRLQRIENRFSSGSKPKHMMGA